MKWYNFVLNSRLTIASSTQSLFSESVENAVLYGFYQVERAKGIEPSLQAWEARVLPLNYARISTKL